MVLENARNSLTRLAFAVFLPLLSTGFGGHPQSFQEPEEEPGFSNGLATPSLSQSTPLVFVSRKPLNNDDPCAVPGLGPRYRTEIVGGKLIARKSDGNLVTLVGEDRLFDVSDPSVSWDGKTVVFSGVEHPDSNWRIFEIKADGSGFRKLTTSNRQIDLSQFGAAAGLFARYDDFDPCFLPDGRVVFSSTRYPSAATADQVLTSNLHVMSHDGKTMRRITTERNGAEEPTIDPVTGRIVYARWWVNPDRPSNVTKTGLSRENVQALTDDIANLWHAVTVRPDGDELKLYAGFMRTRSGSQVYKPAVMNDGRLLGIFTRGMSLTPGILGAGIRWFKKGPSDEHHVIGVRSGQPIPGQRVDPLPYAVDPAPLNDETILFSYSTDGRDYGIYSCRLDGSSLKKSIDLPGTLELDVQVLAARPVPPILQDNFEYVPSHLPPTEDPLTHFNDDVFRFDCMNIFTNAAVDEPLPDAPRIVQNARIRFFMNVQRQNPRGSDPSIFLKDAEVFYHGGVHEHDLPAEVPLFEQIVDKDGRVLTTTDGKFAHVSGFNFERQGAGTKCVGCHIGHSMMEVPINGSIAEWFNVSPSATVTASSVFEQNGHVYVPENLVDRQARTGGDTVLWIANEGAGAYVNLKWEIPIQVREFVVYGLPSFNGKKSAPVVHECQIFLYYQSRQVGHISSAGRIVAEGSRIRTAPTTIDAARIIITKTTGTINQHSVTGLAEVETIARLLQDTAEFNRGR